MTAPHGAALAADIRKRRIRSAEITEVVAEIVEVKTANIIKEEIREVKVETAIATKEEATLIVSLGIKI